MIKNMTRITTDPNVMDGKPCIRKANLRVSTIVDLVAGGKSTAELIKVYPELEAEDVREALWSAGVSEVKP